MTNREAVRRDIAFVLLHNDAGGPAAAARVVASRFDAHLHSVWSAVEDLSANFADVQSQGAEAYASQVTLDNPDVPVRVAQADAVTAVAEFGDLLDESRSCGR